MVKKTDALGSLKSLTLIDSSYRHASVSDTYAQTFGCQAPDLVGRELHELWGQARFEREIRPLLDECFRGHDAHVSLRFELLSADKSIQLSLYPYVSDGIVTHAMVFAFDQSLVKRFGSRLIDLEFKDQTTGLLNRKSFELVLDKEIERAKRSPAAALRALLIISIEGLSTVNARFGVAIGDLIFEATALRVKEGLRTSDYVFRYEGKQLAIILTTIARPSDVSIVAEALAERISMPFRHQGEELSLGSAVGVACYPDDAAGPAELERFAASAMEEAKARGEGLVIFNRALHRSALRKAKLRSELRRALVDGRFDVYYQPIVDYDGQAVGAEALIRWKHESLGFVPPDEFIPLAEEAGYTVMIGRWMLYRVCRFLRQHANALAGRYVSVNLSAKEFSGDSLVAFVQAVLRSTSADPSLLKLEITETESMLNIENAIQKIGSLRALGVEVFVDDFGSGYSSLAYLKRLPVSLVKIDRVFAEAIESDPGELAFVEGMVRMIKGKGMRVLVEGVTEERQQELLASIGVDYLQGYRFGKAIPEPDFVKLISGFH